MILVIDNTIDVLMATCLARVKLEFVNHALYGYLARVYPLIA